MQKTVRLAVLRWLIFFVGAAVSWSAPLIVDHTSVPKYADLSQKDIDRVKTMWVEMLGASHSLGYRVGCQLLQSNVDSEFQVNVVDSGVPESYTTNHLRISRALYNPTYLTWEYGGNEQTWYTDPSGGGAQTLYHLSYCNTNGLNISVFGLAWSWQFSWHNLNTSAPDTNYMVYWSGSSVGGPDGDLAWGLTSASYAFTTNHISMDTYLQTTEGYRTFCRSNGYPTVVIFSTAPVDYTGDTAYQAFLKNNYIRSYVSNSTDAVLFDFADILCWDNAGNRKTNAWTDLGGNPQIYEWIADDNYLNLDGSNGSSNPYHIGERGALRLGKALWWMLAQISAQSMPVTPPVLQASLAGNAPQIGFTTHPNVAYTLQSSPSMAQGSWQTVTNIASQPYEQQIQIVDSSPQSASQLFYRVVYTQ